MDINKFCIGCETMHHDTPKEQMVELEIQIIDGSIIEMKLCRNCYGMFRATDEVVAVLVKS